MKEVSEPGFGTFTQIQRGVSLRRELTLPYGELGVSKIVILKSMKLYNSVIFSLRHFTHDDKSLSYVSDDEIPVIITLCTPDSIIDYIMYLYQLLYLLTS